MRPLGAKKMRHTVAGHQDCGVCFPKQAPNRARAKRTMLDDLREVCPEAADAADVPSPTHIDLDEKHPAWGAIDDDDWSGATFGQWLRHVKGEVVLLRPPPTARDGLVALMIGALRRAGATVFLEAL